MAESKIELHDRLRATGLWSEAAAWKDAKIKELRAQGMKRAEAGEEAWRLLAEKYPPEPADVEPSGPTSEVANRAITPDALMNWLCGAAGHEVRRWAAKHAVTLAADAMGDLTGEVVAYCWMMGLMGYHPGPLYHEEVEATRWCFRPAHQPEPSAPLVAVA